MVRITSASPVSCSLTALVASNSVIVPPLLVLISVLSQIYVTRKPVAVSRCDPAASRRSVQLRRGDHCPDLSSSPSPSALDLLLKAGDIGQGVEWLSPPPVTTKSLR